MHLLEDDVVISGVGGYFPKAKNIEEFKARLLNNENLLETRWKLGERGVCNILGKIPTEQFDNSYFGIHRQQCTFMDPMQRLVLERTYEALVDAGVNPSEIKGRRVGVYMGSAIGENDNLFLESIVSGFGVTGHSRAMMPNRVSYWLNLKGPSVAYDSNWVGGIEVIRLAYNAIKTGQCESVIVGTANLALNAEFQWLYTDMGLLSNDGSTKAFDAEANGYARSDGVVVLYIQRASEARRSYASIVNVSTCFNGDREGNLLDIDVKGLSNFIDDFYKKCNVDPTEVNFVETYGCGIKETDRKELEGLEKVYCKNRKTPLKIGSVKTNTGHSEASSCLFSIVKALIAMESGIIPANIQYSKPNPDIKPLVNGKMEVVTKNTKLEGDYIAVNALGLDSYYAHILLKANSKTKVAIIDDIPRLVIASTRTQAGIDEILNMIVSQDKIDAEYCKLIQDLYSKPILGHLYRGYAMLGAEDKKQESEYHMGNKRQIWFVYSGMGSQWCGMIGDLMKIPVFADAINKCQKVLQPKGVDLMHIISTDDKTIYDNILHSFVGIAAIQIGLTDVLRSIGIVPDGIIGHSVGELGCAYGDGCMTAEQMILSAYSRGRASVEATLIKGMMAAIGMGYQQIKDKCPPTIEVACHNGPDSSTISGPTEDMEIFVKDLQDQGIFARLVNVANIAYHSRYIKPAAPALLKYLKEVIPEPVPRSSKWISTSNLEENWDTELAKNSSAEYHTNNLLSSVLFEEGLRHIPKDSVLIEIAPHGLLQAILKRSVKPGCTNVPLTQRGSKSGVEFLLSSIGKLYLAGLDMNVAALFPKIEYPVSKGTPTLATFAHWEHSEKWKTGLEDKLTSLFGVRDLNVTLNSEEFRDTVGHQLDDKIILPFSAYLLIVFDIISNISTGHKEIVFENLHFKRALTIPKIGSVPLHAMIQKGSLEFEILAGDDIIVCGKLSFPASTDRYFVDVIDLDVAEDNVQLTGSDVYSELQHRGHKYSGFYKTIKSLTITENGSLSMIQWNNKWSYFLEGMVQQFLLQAGERNQEIHIPKTIQKIAINTNLLPTEKKDIKVTYNYLTNVISTEGLQIIGMKTGEFPKDPKPLSFDSLEFVPLYNESCPNMENVINTALHLTLDNFNDQFITNVMITEIESDNPSLLDHVKKVINQYKKLNITTTNVKDPKLIIVQQSYPLLFIFNDTIREDIAKILTSSHGFLLIRTSKEILSHPQIVQVAQLHVGGVNYSILRKAKNLEPIIVNVKSDVLSMKDMSRGSVTWASDLEKAAQQALSKKNHAVYLISSVLPTEGIANFVQELRSLPNMQNVHVFFSLDKRVTDVNTNDLFYKTLFKQDLVLTVLKEGLLGVHIPVPFAFKENILSNLNIASNSLKNRTISFIGVNLRDETLNVQDKVSPDLGNIDYVGVTNNGQDIMGLATFDKDTSKLIPDDILCWNLPSNWTAEDCATIPHAYCSAIYCLLQKAKLNPGETVLIHAGCTPIGLAAISVAAVHGCTVYTTVSTDWQRAYLKKTFDFLKDRNIMSCDNTNFEPLLLMATGGQGAHVILNCLSGNLLQASVSCLADYGRFIQIGKYDLTQNNSIGMSVFLRNTSFYVVDINNIINQTNDVKEELRDLVQGGINKLSVRPIIRKIVDHQNIENILNALRMPNNVGKIIIRIQNNIALSKFNVDKPTKFICDAKSSYLVYGGSVELWADVVEWLILRGARKIIISSESKPQQNHIIRRLSLFQTYFNADIVFATNKAQTREGAAELLSEVYFLGPIHGVFILPSKNNLGKVSEFKPVQYIDNALRTTAPKALFVNFVSSAAGICQVRSESGFYTYNIQWQKELEFTDSLYCLDDILNYKVRNIMIKLDNVSDSLQETSQALFKKLTLMLPSNVEDYSKYVRLSPKKPALIQLPTIGPRVMRELAPIFIVPGIVGEDEIHEFSKELLYPTFYAKLPSGNMTINELAQDISQQMREVWPKGPYNIVAISWGGALSVEIARILNLNKANTHIYFIDSAPTTLQSAIKHLGETDVSTELNILTRILNLNDSDVINKISAAPSWEKRVSIALDNYEKTIKDRESMENALYTMVMKIKYLSAFKPTEELVSGNIYLIRPVGSSKYDNCGLTAYCKQTPQIHLVPGDHLSIIKSKNTIEYINETLQLI